MSKKNYADIISLLLADPFDVTSSFYQLTNLGIQSEYVPTIEVTTQSVPKMKSNTVEYPLTDVYLNLEASDYPVDETKDKLKLGSDTFTHSLLVFLLVNRILSELGESNKTVANLASYSIINLLSPETSNVLYRDIGERGRYIESFGWLTLSPEKYYALDEFIPSNNTGTQIVSINMPDGSYVTRKVLNDDVLEPLLINFLITLDILSQWKFSIGDSGINSIRVVQTKSSPGWAFQITNLEEAMITIPGETQDDNSPLTSQYQITFYQSADEPELQALEPKIIRDINGQQYFILANAMVLQNYRYVPFISPDILLSMDVYTFILSLLSIPDYFYTVFTSQRLKRIFWDSLWFENDNPRIYQRLVDAVDRNHVLSLPGDVRLKLNPISTMLSEAL
jgi:hypothetical protein